MLNQANGAYYPPVRIFFKKGGIFAAIIAYFRSKPSMKLRGNTGMVKKANMSAFLPKLHRMTLARVLQLALNTCYANAES